MTSDDSIFSAFRVRAAGKVYVFVIFLLYVMPVLLNSALRIENGGLENVALTDAIAVWRYIGMWAVAAGAFFLGAGQLTGRAGPFPRDKVKGGGRKATFILAPVLVALKIMLVADGVYESYAFDSGAMTGAVWSMSTALSEMALFLFALSLVVGDRKLTLALFVLLGLNLLHGTRIFTVCAASIFVFFTLVTTKLTRGFIALLVVIGFVVVLGSLGVFLIRSSVDLNDANASELVAYVFSPVLYESVFSQIGLIEVANGSAIVFNCTPVDYLFDLFSFVVPRFFNPGKDAQCINYLYELQPLGALNGVLGVYAYFQSLSAIFFFAIGLLGRAFFFFGRRNAVVFALFIYFFGSIVIRLLRDGPIFAMKFVSVALLTAVVVLALSKLRGAARRRLIGAIA